MATNDLIVAIELGSSKIAGMVGRKDEKGNLEVLAFRSDSSSSFVQKGYIYNIDRAVKGVTGIVTALQLAVHAKISKVYVGFGGQSFRSQQNTVSKTLADNSRITDEIVNMISDENRNMMLPGLEILDVVPKEYKVGMMRVSDPIGMLSNQIEGHFLNIVARPEIRRNLERCFEQAAINIVDDPFIIPLVTAHYVMNPEDSTLGCALVDFGADVTSVAVYHKNILRYFSVIPLGSSCITRDLTTLNIETEEAEELKFHYGDALLQPKPEKDEIIHLRAENQTVTLRKINEIVHARAEEIIANVWNQIKISGYEGRLGAGLIFTGGGANLRNLSEAFIKYVNQDLRIRIALSMHNQLVNGVLFPSDGSLISLTSILLEGKENCCEVIEDEPEPTEETKKIIEESVRAEQPNLFDSNIESEGTLVVDSDSEPVEDEPVDVPTPPTPQTGGSKKGWGWGFIKRAKQKFQEEDEEEGTETYIDEDEAKRNELKDARAREDKAADDELKKAQHEEAVAAKKLAAEQARAAADELRRQQEEAARRQRQQEDEERKNRRARQQADKENRMRLKHEKEEKERASRLANKKAGKSPFSEFKQHVSNVFFKDDDMEDDE